MKSLRIEWHGKAHGKNQRLGKSKYGNFYLKKGYRDFMTLLAWQATLSRLQDPKWTGPFTRDIEVWIEVWVHGRRDVDSLVPVILDSLESASIISDDKQVVSLHVIKNHKKRGEKDRIVVFVGGER
jgi:Holliday junction resolvase RusA-like endonuclease